MVYSKDFRWRPQDKDDPYGHGTHIGATIAGSSRIRRTRTIRHRSAASRLAPISISLRVIGANGFGKASSVMDAIDWAIRNRKRFNIRVINLSLGGAAEESYRDDPMCKAVDAAVHAGIVVVAAAGNRGKDAKGPQRARLIETPGIDRT